MTTVEVLKGARAKLAEPGVWAQAPCPDSAGRSCAFIAIPQQYDEAEDLLMKAIGVETLKDGYSWNDAPERTLEQVLAKFDEAILLAEKQPSPSPSERKGS